MTTVLIALLGATSCSTADGSPQNADRNARQVAVTPGTAADVAALFADLRGRSEARNVTSVDRTFAEGLPNRRYSVDGGEPLQVSSAVVRGTVVDVRPGAAYYVPGDELSPDADGGTEIDFDDERALWRVIEVSVEVSDGVGADAGDTVDFAVTTSLPDPGQALGAARAMGEVVVVLGHPGAVRHDRGLRTIGHWGDSLALVADDGTLSFPTADPSNAKEFIGDLTTWDAVKQATRDDHPVTRVGAGFQRE